MDIEKPEAVEVATSIVPNENTVQKTTIENTHEQTLGPATSNAQNSRAEMEDAPPLTHALEALLGGLDPLPISSQATLPGTSSFTEVAEPTTSHDPMVEDTTTISQTEETADVSDKVMTEAAPVATAIPRLVSSTSTAEAVTRVPVAQVVGALEHSSTHDPMEEDTVIKPTQVTISDTVLATSTTPSLAPIVEKVETSTAATATTAVPELATNEEEQEHPEWEADSSPIESSSDDSSSDDSSSDDSEEGGDAYKLLSPEEQARILMQGDGGSDDEGDSKKPGAGAQLRTKNEVPEVVIPKPDVIITEDMPIQDLGAVETIVENILLIKAQTSGEYRVLESGSVLCLADRTVIGVVSETLGRVQQPLYSVLFTNAVEIKEAGLDKGTRVFYSEKHSTYVFTQALKAYKGSDASNLHDEEVGDEEMEFSDDEAEAEHKRRVKQKRLEKRGGRIQQNGGPIRGGGHPLRQEQIPYDASNGISYDDNDEGPYKPLVRPMGYADSVGRTEAPQEGSYQGGHDRSPPGREPYRDAPPNREQWRGRGRGDRGRGRGDRGDRVDRGDRGRGRGRGGFQDRRNESSGHSQPPQAQRNFAVPPNSANYGTPPSSGSYQPPPSFQPYQQNQIPPVMPPNFFMPQQYSPHQPQMPAWPQFPQLQAGQQAYPWPNMTPNMAPPPPLPGGAYINPAFFNQQQQQQPAGSQNRNQWSPPKQEKE